MNLKTILEKLIGNTYDNTDDNSPRNQLRQEQKAKIPETLAKIEGMIQPDDEIYLLAEQVIRDLKQAHAEIIKLQGEKPENYEWPKWTPQANTIRWAEKILKRKPKANMGIKK